MPESISQFPPIRTKPDSFLGILHVGEGDGLVWNGRNIEQAVDEHQGKKRPKILRKCEAQHGQSPNQMAEREKSFRCEIYGPQTGY